MILLVPEIIGVISVDFIVIILMSTVLMKNISIYNKWNFNNVSASQYAMEKDIYLISTVVKFTFFTKVITVFISLFALDKLSNIIPGAMCATGVINSDITGTIFLVIKIAAMFFSAYWTVLNHYDYTDKDIPYVRLKSKLFFILFILILAELTFELLFFYKINPQKIVSCCGALFGNSIENNNLLDATSGNLGLYLTSAVFIFLLLSYAFNFETLYFIFNIIFAAILIYEIIFYYSPYIYQLPTHRCPFCILQRDYYYVGYIIYFLISLGFFSGIIQFLLKKTVNFNIKLWQRVSISAYSTVYLLLSSYPIIYRIKNGVWIM